MKKSAIKKFNWIAFLIVPVATVFISVVFCLLVRWILYLPTIDYDDVTPQTESGQLWEVLEVVEGEYAYVIYSVDDYYTFDDNNLIAFQGPSIDVIKDEIVPCYQSNLSTSYWEGTGKKFDFSTTNDFEEYLKEVESNTYFDIEPDSEVIMANFSQVTLYDLSDYVGYERHHNAGPGLALIITVLYVTIFTAIALAVELLVAVILKLTVFKVKKENDKIA